MGDYQEVKLQGATWMLHLPVTQEMLGDVSAHAWIDHELQMACIQVHSRLFYENLETIEYPADWWQAIKARWLPGWAKRRWPLRMRHYEINAYYPTLRDPEHQGVVRVPILEA